MPEPTFSEYQVKLAAGMEYRDSIRFKRMYEESALGFIELIKEALDLCEKTGLPLSEKAKFHRLVEKANEIVQYRMSFTSDESLQVFKRDNSDEDLPVPAAGNW